jgi:hypothetical protein
VVRWGVPARRRQEATQVQVWVAPTALTDQDIVLGEGRQIVFVDPTQLDGLDIGEMAGNFIPALLRSATYAELVASGSVDGCGPGRLVQLTTVPRWVF